MADNWKRVYSELKEYIANNPQIEIGKFITRLPNNSRPEFNRLFDMVRVAFLKEKCQIPLNEASPLIRNYAQAASEVKKSLDISEIKMQDELKWFLNDPINGLIRSFYNLLFDLLKEKVNIDAFENEAMELIVSSFKQFFKKGYEQWVVLSLVNLLIPDSASAVPMESIKYKFEEPQWDEKTGLRNENVPDLQELKSLYFGRSLEEDAFITSNIIVHSTKLNRYVSIGAYLCDATWTAKNVSNKREWLHLREIGQLCESIDNWPDMVIYIDEQPEDINLVADFSRFCRPDIIVECKEQADWYQQGGMDEVKQNYNFLRPRVGSYVVSRLPVPEESLKNLFPEPEASEPTMKQKTSQEEEPKEHHRDINILSVGYEQSQLTPIIDVLLARK